MKIFTLISFLLITVCYNHSFAEPIDLNRASALEMIEVEGLSISTAIAIEKHRKKFGEFTSIDSLNKINGINNELIKKLNPKFIEGNKLIIESDQEEEFGQAMELPNY